MAFPTTSVLDDFNRADEGPPPSASWTSVSNGHAVVSNVCVGTGAGDNYSYWDLTTFGPDSECFCTLAGTKPANGVYWGGVGVRNDGASSGYELDPIVQPGTDTWEMYRVDGGAFTQLGASFSQEIATGDSTGLEIVGSTLTAYHKPAAGSWTSLGTRSDGDYASAGFIQLYMSTTSSAVDDFGGGTIVVAPSETLRIVQSNLRW